MRKQAFGMHLPKTKETCTRLSTLLYTQESMKKQLDLRCLCPSNKYTQMKRIFVSQKQMRRQFFMCFLVKSNFYLFSERQTEHREQA